MRYLRGSNLLLPVQPLLGPAPHDVAWRAGGARTRRAGNLAVSGLEQRPSRLRVGRSVSRTLTRLMSIGTSSWRTAGSW
jgi:hypothetical protein